MPTSYVLHTLVAKECSAGCQSAPAAARDHDLAAYDLLPIQSAIITTLKSVFPHARESRQQGWKMAQGTAKGAGTREPQAGCRKACQTDAMEAAARTLANHDA